MPAQAGHSPPPRRRARRRQAPFLCAHQAEIAAQSTPSIVSVHTEHALGTGFIVASDGLVATNLHVVAGNSKSR